LIAEAILLVGQPDNLPFLARNTVIDFLIVSSEVPGGKSVTNFFTDKKDAKPKVTKQEKNAGKSASQKKEEQKAHKAAKQAKKNER